MGDDRLVHRSPEQALADAAAGYAKLYEREDFARADGMVERARRLVAELIDFAGAVPQSVVDVGCGRGHSVRRLLESGVDVVVATDVVDGCMDDADLVDHPGVTFLNQSVLDLEPDVADWFYCVGVTPSVPDELLPAALDRLSASSRCGGLLAHCMIGHYASADDLPLVASGYVLGECEIENRQRRSALQSMVLHHLRPRHIEDTYDGGWYYAKVRR